MKSQGLYILAIALLAVVPRIHAQEAVQADVVAVVNEAVADSVAADDIIVEDAIMVGSEELPAMTGEAVQPSVEWTVRPGALTAERPSLYALPYSMTESHPNWKRLWINTGALFGAGFATVGILELLPENATAWNKADRRPMFRRWWDHVSQGPVMDHDNGIFNYILHPYGGAAYYMSARSQGFNVLQSFAYSSAVSTFFWEYGIEAFEEIPSIQDIFITPIVGSALGEGFYILKRHIVSHGYRLWGSPVLGNVVAFLIDPVNEVVGLFGGNEARGLYQRTGRTSSLSPMISPHHVGFTFAATF